MRITRNISGKDDDIERVELNEDDEFVKIDRLEYTIYISPNEYRKIIPDILEEYVAKALVRSLDVYCAYSAANIFMLCGLDLATSQETIIVFQTTDIHKFGSLEDIVKKFAKAIKKANEEKEDW